MFDRKWRGKEAGHRPVSVGYEMGLFW